MRDFIKFGPWARGKTWHAPETVSYLPPAVQFSYRPFGQVFLSTCAAEAPTEKADYTHE